MTSDDYDIDFMLRKLNDAYEKAGFRINVSKIKYLVVGKDLGKSLDLNGQDIEICEQYKYLGTVIVRGGNSRREIYCGMVQARQAIQKLNSLLWSRSVGRTTKKIIYETIVQSILLYGAETWEITQRDREELLAVEMDFLRRRCRVSRLEHVRNEEIRRRMGMESTVQYMWYGHVQCMEPQTGRKDSKLG